MPEPMRLGDVLSSLPTSSPVPAPPTPPVSHTAARSFFDPGAVRKAIYDNVLRAASAMPPVSTTRHRLEFSGLHYADKDDYSPEEEKKALLSGDSLYRRLRGTARLIDLSTNQPVGEKQLTLAQVPHLSSQGTFILNGSGWGLKHQMRLRSGAFTRVGADGTLATHLNTLPGKGLSHHYWLDPETGAFKLQLGQSSVPLLPLLRSMGATDSELKEAWGPEILAANQDKNEVRTINSLYARILGSKAREGASNEEKGKALADAFLAMELDPEVTSRTLSRPAKNVDKATVLDITRKLLAVNRNEADTDDRDHLAYQHFLGPEDLLAERFDRAGPVLRPHLWKAANRGNLDSLPPNFLTKHLHDAIMGSGLGSPGEEVNPLELLDQQTAVTRMGVGGISCYSADTEVLTKTGWKLWPEVKADDKLARLAEDETIEYVTPLRLFQGRYVGPMFGMQNVRLDLLVTPEHRHWVKNPQLKGGYCDFRFRTAEKIHEMHSKFRIAAKPDLVSGNSDPEFFELPPAPCEGQNRSGADVEPVRIPFQVWCDFLAAYLADGSFSYVPKRSEYRIEIGKKADKNPEEATQIQRTLEQMPFAWRYEQGRRFIIKKKNLAFYLSRFGKSREKYIPDYIMNASFAVRDRFWKLLSTFDCSYIDERRRKYATASKRLRDQVELLARHSGKSVICSFHNRNGEDAPQYIAVIRDATETQIAKRAEHKGGNPFYITQYDGIVYCADVGGSSLLLVRRNGKACWSGNSPSAIPMDARAVHPSQLGYVDLLRTPESLRAGVDLRLAFGARKGSKGEVLSPFLDVRNNNQQDYYSPTQLADKTVTFPDEWKSGKPYVRALVNSRLRNVPREKVDLIMPHFEYGFSPLTNLVPLKSTMKGQRASMTSRFLTQAMSLEGGEAPLVQNAVPGTDGKKSFDEVYGRHMGAIAAEPLYGRVSAVTPNKIEVKYEDGSKKAYPLYATHPFNRKSFLTTTPLVKPGDPVKPAQILAHSNYTDPQGRLAIGLNPRVAYITWRGKNYEDAIAVSRSFADKMKSQHHYQHTVEWEPTHIRGKRAFLGAFAGKFDKKIVDTLDDDGIVKPGTVVKPGDPLIVAVRERDPNYKSVHGGRKSAFADASTTWDHEHEGIVTDAVKTDKGVNVAVSSVMPMQEADKISSRFANKGIVTIIDDEDMPHDKQGKPFEVALNPLGIQTRTNLGVAYETILGKIAHQRGEPYKIEDFSDIKDMAEFVSQELKKHGLESTETVVDPRTGRHIPGVLTGRQFMMKLHHTSAGKGQGRGIGAYSAEDTPARGGYDGAKQQSLQETGALLSAGAVQLLRDSKLVRGQKNQEFWSMFMAGHKPPTPKVPFVYHKFVEQLRGGGVNVVRKGSSTQIMPMTRKAVDDLVGDRELKNVETVDWRGGLKPVAGGLFDERLTGSHSGSAWSYIKLHEPLPNPVMEDGVRRLMGLTQAQFRETLAGQRPYEGKTGPQAIAAAMAKIDVDKAIEQAMGEVRSNRKTARDEAIKKLHFLVGAKKLGQTPSDWFFDKVPVLPPKYRPVSVMANTGGQLVADANLLYKEVWDANQALKELSGVVTDVGQERLNLYDAWKGAAGLGDPIQPKNVARGVKGLLDQVFSDSPKFSTLQRKLLSTPVDVVGRGVVMPNPDYSMDEVGIPENQAWDVYKLFAVRRMVRAGMPRLQAAQAVQDKTPAARKAMLAEMDERPVVMSRAPVLHRYGIQAFWPKLVKGDAIQVSPVVTAGMGMDFDGDQQFSHVIFAIAIDAQKGFVENGLVAPHFLESSIMAARFKTSLPAIINSDVFVGHLQDFPHGGLVKTTRGQFGAIDWYAVPPGVKVLAMGPDGKLGWSDVSLWSVHRDCPVQLVNLQSGRQIFTDDDPRAVFGVTGDSLELCRATPAKAAEKPFIVPRVVCRPEVAEEERLQSIRVRDDWRASHDRAGKLRAEIPLTHDFGYLCGAIIGDGWVSTKLQLSLASITPAIAEKCTQAIQALFDENAPKTGFIEQSDRTTYGQDSYGKSARYTWSSVELSRMLVDLIGQGAENKHLPGWFLRTPLEFQEGLFAGLLDTDGTICIAKPKPTKPKPQLMCSYSSTSLKLCQEIVLLAGGLGIRARITGSKTPGGKPAWVLSFSAVDIKKWSAKGMVHPDKVAACEAGVVDATGGQTIRFDLIPLPPGLALEFRRIVGLPKKKENRLEGHATVYAVLHNAATSHTIPRHTARRVLELVRQLGNPEIDHPEYARWLKILNDETVTWDPVESFEDTGNVQTGYDLTVPGAETFADATGVILSNTSTFHVPVSEEAVDDAVNKLMPSRNLLSPADFKPAFAPRQEFHGGLYLATAFRNDKRKPEVFRSKADMLRAIERGEIDADQPVTILDHS